MKRQIRHFIPRLKLRSYSDDGVHRLLNAIHVLGVAPCKPEVVTGRQQRRPQPGPEFTEAETQSICIIRRT